MNIHGKYSSNIKIVESNINLASTAVNLGPRSGPTKCLALSGSKLVEPLIVSLKEFFERNDFDSKEAKPNTATIQDMKKCLISNTFMKVVMLTNHRRDPSCGLVG